MLRGPAEGSSPRSPEAARLYGEALRDEEVFDFPAAREALLRAGEREPENPRILGALAQVQLELGHREKAREAAFRAIGRAVLLDAEERLRLEITYRRVINDTAGALELGLKDFRLHPDDLEAGLLVVELYMQDNRRREVLATIAQLRLLPAPQGTDPRLDLAESEVHNLEGDAKAAQAAALRAGAAASAKGAREMVAEARYREAQALVAQGDRAGAMALYSESERIRRELGDRGLAADSSMMIATVLADSGDLLGARSRFEAVRAEWRTMGVPYKEAVVSGNLAVLLRRQRNLPQALELARGARTAFLESEEPWAALHAQALVAEIERDLGDLAAARADYLDSLATQRKREDTNLARTLLQLAEVELRRGAFAEVLRDVAEVKALPRQLPHTAALQDLLLARVALEEGKPAEAEPLARSAVAQAGTFERNDEAAGAHAVLALALLGRGKAAEARKAADDAVALITPASDFHPRVTLAHARAAAAEQPRLLDESLAAAQAVEAEARRSGVVDNLLEARFAIGALEQGAGLPRARAHLVALSLDARSRGYLALADRAQALARAVSSRP